MSHVTIETIAERAGVSRGTVDRALHNRQEINPEIREHVLSVARLLGYPLPVDEAGARKKSIGVILPGQNWFDQYLKNEWMKGVSRAKEQVESMGYRVELAECETSRSGEVIEQIDRMTAEGIGGLVLTARDDRQIREKIDACADAGIPTITYNSDIEGKRVCFIGQDPYQSGRVAADVMLKYVDPARRILIIAGNLEFSGHKSRVNGFLDKCAEAGLGRDQMVIEESYNDYQLTYTKVCRAFAEDSLLASVYMANESIVGCADALDDMGLRDRVLVVGNDLTAGTRRLLMEGAVNFIIEQNVYWQGYRPVVLMKKLLEMPGAQAETNTFSHIRIANRETVS